MSELNRLFLENYPYPDETSRVNKMVLLLRDKTLFLCLILTLCLINPTKRKRSLSEEC